MAEREGFEPPVPLSTAVFKTAVIDHSTTFPMPVSQDFLSSGKRDSNSRPQPWQGCALPTELFPQSIFVKRMRLELTRPNGHYPLKVARLPIPPSLHFCSVSQILVWFVPRTGLEPARLSTLAPETSASTIPPPGQSWAENETRTRDPNLGKVMLYQLSYFRIIYRVHTMFIQYFKIILWQILCFASAKVWIFN